MPEEVRPILTKERNLITFWEEAVERNVQGRVEFDKVLFVKIMTPGDKSEVVYEVERQYADGFPNPVYGKVRRNEIVYKRFSDYIEAWRKRHETGLVVDGTPIETWAQVDVRRAALLKHLGVFSVESLAILGDSGAQQIGMGGRELIQKAKDWVAQKDNSALAMQVSEKNRELESRLSSMQEQIDELGEVLNELPPEARSQAHEIIKRRRGRPPKAAA